MPVFRPWLTRMAFILAMALSLTTGVAAAAPPEAVLAEQAQVVMLVNQQRAAAGLAPLVVNETLADGAQSYAEYMANANFFSHTGPDGSNVTARAEKAGYTSWVFLAENLAAGQPTPDRVVQAWMNSPTHRANILAPEAKEVGLGHAFNPNARFGNYWALEFGTQW
jgi:uncharacterized protein YkwD